MDADYFIEKLTYDLDVEKALYNVSSLSEKEAEFEFIELDEIEIESLKRLGIERLYKHQVESLNAIRKGKNVLLSTPTASGKSVVFYLAILDKLRKNSDAKTLIVYPLKALARDQIARMKDFFYSVGVKCAVYDGDTPLSERECIRKEQPQVLLTNPDMLHFGILRNWKNWERFLCSLTLLVLDELHIYRGIFGSNFNHILARMRRFSLANLQIVAASATIGNPKEFASQLTDCDIEVIDRSGAPSKKRYFLFFNSLLCSSSYSLALKLFVRSIEAGKRTILFTKSRVATESIYSKLKLYNSSLAKKVTSYRAGYLPSERRFLERKLFNGELLGVISTSALEMGVDIGALDAVILLGFPGSIISFWQRIGRVGRRDRESYIALVAMPDALDQFYVRNTHLLLNKRCEEVAINPYNRYVASWHLRCAAVEKPILKEEPIAKRFNLLLKELADEGILEFDGSFYYSRGKVVHDLQGIRGEGGKEFVIRTEDNRKIGTISGVRAYLECHKGAIYLHRGDAWEVTEFNEITKEIIVKPAYAHLYTKALTRKNTTIIAEYNSFRAGRFTVSFGEIEVEEEVVAYEVRNSKTGQLLGIRECKMPKVVFNSHSIWFKWDDKITTILSRNFDYAGSIHAFEHVAIALIPSVALCDRNDLGGISFPYHEQIGSGVVFIYESYRGGMGVVESAFGNINLLLRRIVNTLENCSCDDGCPACIHSPKCGNGNRPLDKKGSLFLAKIILEELSSPDTLFRASKEQNNDSYCTCKDKANSNSHLVWIKKYSSDIPKYGVIVFDIETLRSAAEVGGWNNVKDMGVALSVVYHLESKQFATFKRDETSKLLELLLSADTVIGFNVKKFDYKVLEGELGISLSSRLTSKTIDIFEKVHTSIGKKVSLANLARNTLGKGKIANGMQSLVWVKKNRLDLVEEYCKVDVEITKELYIFGKKFKYLLCNFNKKLIKVEVDW